MSSQTIETTSVSVNLSDPSMVSTTSLTTSSSAGLAASSSASLTASASASLMASSSARLTVSSLSSSSSILTASSLSSSSSSLTAVANVNKRKNDCLDEQDSAQEKKARTDDGEKENKESKFDVVHFIKQAVTSPVQDNVKQYYDMLCAQDGDLKILLAEGKSIMVHSIIFRMGSAEFNTAVKKAKNGQLNFCFTYWKSVIYAILYIYCHITVMPESIDDKLQYAERYHFFGMTELCKNIMNNLNSTTTLANVFTRVSIYNRQYETSKGRYPVFSKNILCNLIEYCTDMIAKEYRHKIAEDHVCIDNDNLLLCLGGESALGLSTRQLWSHSSRMCCSHNNPLYPDPTTEYKHNNKTLCYHYTLHNQPVPEDACVNFCCMHRNKKFYDSVDSLQDNIKLLVFSELRKS